MFQFFKGYFSSDLAIDLGTANTLIYVRGGPGTLAAPAGSSALPAGRGHRQDTPLVLPAKP